jgi:hypothetical protein
MNPRKWNLHIPVTSTIQLLSKPVSSQESGAESALYMTCCPEFTQIFLLE